MPLRIFLLVTVLSLLPSPAGADPTLSTNPSAEESAGFRWLFDGQSTDAWRQWDADTFPAKGWVIEDGCLKCQRSNGRPNGGGGDLVTRDAFTDFDVRWEWRMSPGGNSGVKYFIDKQPADHFIPLYSGDKGHDYFGHEYQMLDDLTHPDAKRGPTHLAAAFYDILPPNDTKRLRPVGQFNDSRILVQANHVEHWLNGAKVLEYDLGSPALTAAIAKSKYKNLPAFGSKKTTPLLLQDHGSDVWFRNFRILDLTPKDGGPQQK